MDTAPRNFRAFYLALALAISTTAFVGFYFTYFSPMVAGVYPKISLAVHVHGWTFFLWYLLFPLQAALMATGRRRLHFVLGGASIVLAAAMAFTGLLVASVRIDEGLTSVDGSPLDAFWKTFGLAVISGLILFAVFYGAAIANRGHPETHKRLMVMASASALAAAVFRIFVAMFEFNWLATPPWVMPAAIFLPNAFILAGVIYDLVVRRSIHPAYIVGLPIAVAVEGAGFVVATSPAGDPLAHLIASFSDLFGFLY